MGIEVRWYNDDQTILWVHYPERWTWDEYHVIFEQAKVMIESVRHDVFVIQTSEIGFKHLPSGQALPILKRVAKRRPQNLQKSFMVIHSELSRNFAEMMIKVLPENRHGQPTVFVNSVEEALAQIAKTPAG
jgi:hypothetical protein